MRRVVGWAARLPLTITLVLLVVAVGVISGGLWSPAEDQGWYEAVAYGLPAFEEGRWWTPLTGTLLVTNPLVYIPTLLGYFWVGFLEWNRGWRRTLLYFAGGQAFAILAAAAFLAIFSLVPWPWAVDLSQQLDVGSSGGTTAAFAASMAVLPAPWRQRGWVVAFGFAAISLLFLGDLADLEHAFAVVGVMVVDRAFRIRRTTIREQRLIAFGAIIGLGGVQLLTLFVPTNGPLGPTEALDGPWLDAAVDILVVLVVAHGLRLGRRWAWVLTVVWGVLSIVTGLLALYFVITPVGDVEYASGGAHVTVGTSLLWVALMIYLAVTFRAFGSRRRHPLSAAGTDTTAAPTAEDARRMIRAHGGGTLSWMTTWEGMHYYRTSRGIVAYQAHHGVALALSDPLGTPDSIAESVDEFAAAAERDALIPCFFSAGQPARDALPSGWRDLIIADDTIVDLPDLAFKGKPWSHVRQAMNRAARENVSFRMTTLADEPFLVRQQLHAISESWVGDKGLPEMRFTLGTLQEADDPEVRLALALSSSGEVDGFLSWLPVYGPSEELRGWTLDLMRRRDGGFSTVMEFLIASSAQHFSDEGAQILSLSGAPLAHEVTSEEGRIAHLLEQLSSTLEPVYGFSALHRFKKKFNPRFEPIYLLYRDEGDLARISAALTRAFLPDATLRQLAAAGVDIVRGKLGSPDPAVGG